MRDLHLFSLHNAVDEATYRVSAIHDDAGYQHLREALARQIADSSRPPDIQVISVDRWGDRQLRLKQMDQQALDLDEAQKTLGYIQELWGYDVHLDMEDQTLTAPQPRPDDEP